MPTVLAPSIHPHPGPAPELPELPEGVTPGPRWAPWLGPLALLGGLAGALFGGLVIGLVSAAAGASLTHPPPGVGIAETVVQDLAFVGAAVMFAGFSGRRPRRADFGLRPAPVWSSLGWLLVAWGAFLLFSGLWAAIVADHSKQRLLHELGADRSTVALIAVALLVTVVAPACEELFFRGFFYRALSNWRGPWLAAGLTGLVFGAVHAGPDTPAALLVPLAFFGFVLCLLYRRTRSLYPCIVLHVINNSLAFGVTEHWDWQIPVLMAGALTCVGLLGVLLSRRPPATRPAPAAATA